MHKTLSQVFVVVVVSVFFFFLIYQSSYKLAASIYELYTFLLLFLSVWKECEARNLFLESWYHIMGKSIFLIFKCPPQIDTNADSTCE